MVADITVFDEETVIDKADFDDPKQYAEGIEHVLVNGQFALRDRELTGNQVGQALKRSGDMPSRPMSLNEEQQVKVVGKIDQTEERKDPFVHIKVEQGKHDSKPKGTFRLIDKKNGLYIKSRDIGLLQTYEGWASFTGTAKLKNSETVPVLIKMDEVNPFTGKQTIDIQVGDHHYEGELKGMLDIQ
ncbi:hypothetical protein ACTWQL_16765 [Pseudalkalibacillus sp. R45]|uniref:hypothetical protein n=1 Tax=Pseudalkalibacillus sp. R45 TaxID=3457433 RepID=UPI003FCC652E